MPYAWSVKTAYRSTLPIAVAFAILGVFVPVIRDSDEAPGMRSDAPRPHDRAAGVSGPPTPWKNSGKEPDC